ncbi:MAG: hypothetical protein EOP56_17395 [Sphingobacteriales bacterium]|nr:MAG: hypothetical protein EOP56_17395 [Sphingobacteriales bacterium]
MLKRSLVILSCSLMLWGCKKDNDNNTTATPPTTVTPTPTPTTPVQDSSYIIGGVQDVTLTSATDEKELMLAFSPMTSVQKRLTLSVEGLPDGVTGSFSMPTGNVPFVSDLTIKNDFAEAGTYDVTVRGKAEDELTKSLKFKLSVPSYTCIERLKAKVSGYRHAGTGIPGGTPISAPVFKGNRIWFESLYVETKNPGTMGAYSEYIRNFEADIDCEHGTLTIAKNADGSYVYEGSGTFSFTEKKFHIDYTVTSGPKKMNFTIDATVK